MTNQPITVNKPTQSRSKVKTMMFARFAKSAVAIPVVRMLLLLWCGVGGDGGSWANVRWVCTVGLSLQGFGWQGRI
ncbi:hypothetical protein Hanom_Chr15g01375981 [Helianthus anomalus]